MQQCILIFLFSTRDLSEKGRASDRRNRCEDRGGGGRKKARSHHFLPPRRRKKKKEFGTCGPPFSIHTREREKSFSPPAYYFIVFALRRRRIRPFPFQMYAQFPISSLPSTKECFLVATPFISVLFSVPIVMYTHSI